jgi:large subunit ribosomal protein L24
VPDVRKGDEVVVLAGKEAGKHGTVAHVVRNRQGYRKVTAKYGPTWRRTSPLADVAVVIEGLNIAKRHTKARPPRQDRAGRVPRSQQGGILDVPQPILASKVMLICPHCTQPARVRHGIAGDGRSVRICANCGETLTREVKK